MPFLPVQLTRCLSHQQCPSPVQLTGCHTHQQCPFPSPAHQVSVTPTVSFPSPPNQVSHTATVSFPSPAHQESHTPTVSLAAFCRSLRLSPQLPKRGPEGWRQFSRPRLAWKATSSHRELGSSHHNSSMHTALHDRHCCIVNRFIDMSQVCPIRPVI